MSHLIGLIACGVEEVLAFFLGEEIANVADGPRLTDKQTAALAELEAGEFLTAQAWRIKEKLRWVRAAETHQAARWRITHFLRHARQMIDHNPVFENPCRHHVFRRPCDIFDSPQVMSVEQPWL